MRTLPRALIAYNGYDSGLGNRVRVVLGAKALAELENRRLFYVWPTGTLFGPRFTDLWNFRGHTIPRSVSRAFAPIYPYHDEKLDWINDRERRRPLWQIRTGSPLQLPPEAGSWQEEFRGLVPVDAIAARVHKMHANTLGDQPYVGVMIRAHAVSHRRTVEASPVEWYVRRMRELQEVEPSTRFFLSCDVEEVQREVMRQIPNCTAQFDKGGYNSLEGVRSSIVDLYLLACSGYLLGPHFSSFVHLAEHLAGDQLTFETSMGRHGEPIDFRAQGVVTDPLVPALRVR